MKALIATSGGVDSSVTAILMKKMGYNCTCVNMKLTADSSIDIPCRVVDLVEEFRREVIGRFVTEYIEGRTPNPCIYCNRRLKFGRLYDYMQEQGFDCIATGHYAQIAYEGRWLLKKAMDEAKDQSYVLYTLTQQQLPNIKFPLGSMTKSQVRAIAMENGLVNANKQDSQDVCFIPDGDYGAFIERYTGKTFPCGAFVDKSGNILGKHGGIIRYTIGQRKGLGIALGEPAYVLEKSVKDNTVTLGRDEDLFSKTLLAREINLIAADEFPDGLKICAKVRYNQKEQPARVWRTGPDKIRVEFDEAQRAIASGQSVVLYDGDIVVGGGTII